MKSLPVLLLAAVCLLASARECRSETHNKCSDPKPTVHCDEVTIGVQVWSYDRLFPLLDGLFQDVSATQIAAVTLNPNSSNSTQLDAITQSLQEQLGYSKTAAQQNEFTSQALAGNASQQNLLLQQQNSILQQITSAQSQVSQAQATLQNDLANKQADAVITADSSSVTQAQANLSSLLTQLNQAATQFKAANNLPSFSNPGTGNAVTPTSIPQSSVWSQSGNAPSFPATKQMDNQVQLLWERLSRLVGAMVKPDSAPDDATVYLLQFDTGIFPADRKNQLLNVNYELGCASGTAPTVIDVFPRLAAVNITNTKYRDNQIFLGIPLYWFGIGSVTSYNREHLQISQYLGQSSYITGQGVNQSTFGWKFGIPLGDNQLSPDTRKTFALVSVPRGCNTPSVKTVTASWVKKNGKPDARQDNLKTAIGAFPAAPAAPGTTLLESLQFNQVEYDPSTVNPSNPVVVSLTLKLKKDIDQQQTVMVNGTLIKRARDGFGRAIGSGGSGGLLESSSLSVNTWIPVSSRTVLLNLDGVMFAGGFPQILFASPKTTTDLSTELFATRSATCPPTTVSGLLVEDDQYCLSKGTPLAFRKATVRPITVVRVLQGLSMPGGTPRLMFTDIGAAQPAGTQASGTTTDVRVISTSALRYWSTATEVFVESAGKLTHLNCDTAIATGSKLICDFPASAGDIKAQQRFRLVDRAHTLDSLATIGPIKGWASLDSCVQSADPTLETCQIPTMSEIVAPTPSDDGKGWNLGFNFINLNDKDTFPMTATLGTGSITVGGLSYPGNSQPLNPTFTITPAQMVSDVHDSMNLQLTNIVGGKKHVVQTVKLANILTNLSPKATTIATDFRQFSGNNLIGDFTAIRVGDNPKTHEIKCNGGTICQLNVGEDLTKDPKGGYVYLIPKSAPNLSIPLMTTQNGATVFATYTPPPPKDAAKDKTATTPPVTINFAPQINNQASAATAPIVGTQNVVNPTAPASAPTPQVPPQ